MRKLFAETNTRKTFGKRVPRKTRFTCKRTKPGHNHNNNHHQPTRAEPGTRKFQYFVVHIVLLRFSLKCSIIIPSSVCNLFVIFLEDHGGTITTITTNQPVLSRGFFLRTTAAQSQQPRTKPIPDPGKSLNFVPALLSLHVHA